MVLRPYSADLQKAYRDTLGTPGAPETIDDSQPVLPVAVVAQVNTSSTSTFVKITDGTDTAAVNTDGSLIVAPNVGAMVQFAFTGTGSVATAYTVTTGKTFYLMNIMGFDHSSGTSREFYASNGTTKRFTHFDGNTGNSGAWFAFYPMASWASGEFVKINAPVSDDIYCVGFEL
jgi:hypothetical protein